MCERVSYFDSEVSITQLGTQKLLNCGAWSYKRVEVHKLSNHIFFVILYCKKKKIRTHIYIRKTGIDLRTKATIF